MSVERILIAYCPGFMLALLMGRYPLQERERSHRIISFCTGEEKAFSKAGEVPAGKLLLVSQFLLVAHGKQLAAAAAPGIGAGE